MIEAEHDTQVETSVQEQVPQARMRPMARDFFMFLCWGLLIVFVAAQFVIAAWTMR